MTGSTAAERSTGYRTITVSSRALGPRLRVTVKVYDHVSDMQLAASRYNGSDQAGTLGVTQATTDQHGRAHTVTVRLVSEHLGIRVVSHEIHHAATALYGAAVGDRVSSRAHLNHYNEPFAHLYSDLLRSLVDRLYALGYYTR